ncbi:glycoside hydrolase family 15 protein [Nocardioides astragali]|uniref:Glycoside hydrolase family 15 protein n=1 Tax=Nocardioides astragali TaxID=1776736 RepID=A0ABW2N8F8_9ACTN|nr:glycoside hydrolase family 15 protein [Nocardioides astragali]
MPRHIEDYALIGDLRTAALVGLDGAIEWLSLPRFDSPAVYASLLGEAQHGQWRLAPAGQGICSRRRYQTNTLLLETEWTTADGVVRITDFMVPGSSTPMVVRIVDGLVGTVEMRTHIAPRMGYGKDAPTLSSTLGCLVATAGSDELWLTSDVPLNATNAAWTGTFTVSAADRVSFTLVYNTSGEPSQTNPDAEAAMINTATFWTEWVGRSTYAGRWETEVNASLILLKALTYSPTGSILAAATTSLPELVGGTRNWDYRYSWLRDATFTLKAFLSTGHLEEAEAWRDWLVHTVMDDPSAMQIMYSVDGAGHLPEQTLDWLPGHADSTPVRVGNAAATQQQNDVWGEVLDILSTARDAGVPDAPEQAKLEAALLSHIESHWRETDHGLWEVRGPRRHFAHSKLLAWVGVDRAVKHLEQQQPDQENLGRLKALRQTIAQEISDRAYHPGRRAFTQSYGSRRLDAAVLLMPHYGFLPWDDPRMMATVDAIQSDLTLHGLVLRYAVTDGGHNVDGLPGSEGAFLAASFWLADALQGQGRTEEATELFKRLLSLRNDVGLLSEEYDPSTARHLGNTPQAFSHASLVITALSLSKAGASATSSATSRGGIPEPTVESRAEVA